MNDFESKRRLTSHLADVVCFDFEEVLDFVFENGDEGDGCNEEP